MDKEMDLKIFRMTETMEREILWRAEQQKLQSMRRIGLNGQVIMKRLSQGEEARWTGTYNNRQEGR